jgi:hypothetical protein
MELIDAVRALYHTDLSVQAKAALTWVMLNSDMGSDGLTEWSGPTRAISDGASLPMRTARRTFAGLAKDGFVQWQKVNGGVRIRVVISLICDSEHVASVAAWGGQSGHMGRPEWPHGVARVATCPPPRARDSSQKNLHRRLLIESEAVARDEREPGDNDNSASTIAAQKLQAQTAKKYGRSFWAQPPGAASDMSGSAPMSAADAHRAAASMQGATSGRVLHSTPPPAHQGADSAFVRISEAVRLRLRPERQRYRGQGQLFNGAEIAAITDAARWCDDTDNTAALIADLQSKSTVISNVRAVLGWARESVEAPKAAAVDSEARRDERAKQRAAFAEQTPEQIKAARERFKEMT